MAEAAKILIVTGNRGKVREIEAILDRPLELLDLDLPEIQAIDVEAVVRAKAEAAFAHAGRPVLVEDTGLYIDGLGGLPGALVKWFVQQIGPAGICAMLPAGANRDARARSAVAVCDEAGVTIVTGDVLGRIVETPRGTGGFGWDAAFEPAGTGKTFAEMDQTERHRHSMRRVALEQWRDRIIAGHG